MSRRLCFSPVETWRWIEPDQVVATALAAVFEARKAVSNSEGQPWFEEGMGWNDREGYAAELVRAFAQGIERRAAAAGLAQGWLPGGGYIGVIAVERPAGPSMAHGCAAVASAVGSAPASVAGGAASPPGDRFSLCPEGQELPPVASAAHTQTAIGGRNDR